VRIISGQFKGRVLRAPSRRSIRPTQGHVRQVLFDLLGESILDARVLDLFAGSGAVGIEALSRGAAEAVFVEREAASLRCLRENLALLDLTDRAKVLAAPVTVGLRLLEQWKGSFDWIFADPPYSMDSEDWMRRAARRGPGAILAPTGTLVLECSRRRPGPATIGRLQQYRAHTVGETSLRFYEWEDEGRNDASSGDLPGDV